MADADPSTTEARRVIVELNAQGVLSPALIAMRDSLEMIAISIDALKDTNFKNPPTIPHCFYNFAFKVPENEDPDERRVALTRWLLTKGFHELVRGIHETLERAYLYITLLQMKNQLPTYGDFEAALPAIKKKAEKAVFPDLIKLVSAGLDMPLAFEAECLSLQKVRNCLEHRAGIVTIEDTKGDEALRLVLPVLKVFIMRDGAEVELQHDLGEDHHVYAGQEVFVRRNSRERSYKLGERIQLTPADYQEITQACWMFVSDLGRKLPKKANEVSTPPHEQNANP
jgi:hypothetical protein